MSKGLIRSLNRRGTRSNKVRAGEARTGRLREPAACERCGAIFVRRAWRRPTRVSHLLLSRATWMVCPACGQAGAGEGFGRVLVARELVAAHGDALRRRIENVAARAARTQPERRVASIAPRDGGLDILTTSQKLAHRIVHELKKAFGGRASYAWSDDGTLLARWDGPRPRA